MMPALIERASVTKTLQFMTDHVVPANSCISLPPYTEVDGYDHVSITVQFNRDEAEAAPVDLGVSFAFDAAGTMASRCYVSLEANQAAPQKVNLIEVSGGGAFCGSPHRRSSYTVYLPVLAPFVQVFVCNRASVPRRVNVWAYLLG